MTSACTIVPGSSGFLKPVSKVDAIGELKSTTIAQLVVKTCIGAAYVKSSDTDTKVTDYDLNRNGHYPIEKDLHPMGKNPYPNGKDHSSRL